MEETLGAYNKPQISDFFPRVAFQTYLAKWSAQLGCLFFAGYPAQHWFKGTPNTKNRVIGLSPVQEIDAHFGALPSRF